MRSRVIANPIRTDVPPTGDVLLEHLADQQVTSLAFAVAWAKRSGMSRLEVGLRSFRERGGRVLGIVGVDERGATRQGLELARSLSDELFIFNEPSGGTFHPKLYVFRGEHKAFVLTGSANFTRGGLYDNYEVSTELELDLPQDAEVLARYDAFLQTLRDESELCLPATPELIERLAAEGVARDEDERAERPTADKTSSSDKAISLFGRALKAHVSAPTAASPSGHSAAPGIRGARPASEGPEPAAAAPSRTAVPAPAPAGAPAAATVRHRWYRQLDRASAQQPTSARTAVTGVLRLAQAGHAIDHRTYFRDTLFGSATWTDAAVSGKPAEETTIQMRVTIAGREFGEIPIKVDHAVHRIADQGNVPTVLHWGPILNPILRAQSQVGDYVLIEAMPDGTFRLTIQDDDPDGAVF